VIRELSTEDAPLEAIHALMLAAFDDFEDSDWEHALGGTHVIAEAGGTVLAHAAVVERTIDVDGRPFATGYVEAVATLPARQGEGHGTRVMERIGGLIGSGFELGVLGTEAHHFYERLGWERWRGESWVRRRGGLERTAWDDPGIMLLRIGPSAAIALDGRITCDERPGDVW
jgi:aminoglycoside 2'-N-acetyltransferase I